MVCLYVASLVITLIMKKPFEGGPQEIISFIIFFSGDE